MTFIINIFGSAWQLLLASSIYILFGLLVSGLLKVFLDPNMVVRHLGHGRFASVFKAALLGIPIPLCSCGVLPAALSLKKQGASNGATTAFMISTPESGVDSIAISYALLVKYPEHDMYIIVMGLPATDRNTLAGWHEQLDF